MITGDARAYLEAEYKKGYAAGAEAERTKWVKQLEDCAICAWTWNPAHTPKEAIHALLCDAERIALDPRVSEAALALVAQGAASRDAEVQRLREVLGDMLAIAEDRQFAIPVDVAVKNARATLEAKQ